MTNSPDMDRGPRMEKKAGAPVPKRKSGKLPERDESPASEPARSPAESWTIPVRADSIAVADIWKPTVSCTLDQLQPMYRILAADSGLEGRKWVRASPRGLQ